MGDFGFAFNDKDLSDPVLRIEILSEEASDDHCVRKRKRRIHYLNKENGDASHSSNRDSDSLECCGDVKVKILHLSSLLLAEKSPFFYKLFKNGMRETQDSQEKHSTLRIDKSEEAALMDLLKFIYTNTMSATTTPDLINLLMVADKFEVISCMRYCTKLLTELPMSLESALLYFELPSSVLMAEGVQPLRDAANKYLKKVDFAKSQEELMALPLSAIQILLGSGILHVNTEDSVLNFILKWAHSKHPNLEERREILTKYLARFICFPNLSCSKLKEVLVCPDFDHEEATKLVLEALFFKIEVPSDQATTNCGFSGRVYNFHPIKAVQFERPWPRCVVYFDLDRKDCYGLFPSGQLFSQPFCLGGKWLLLSAKCIQEKNSPSHHFGLFVRMKEASESCTLGYEFAVMEESSKDFQRQIKVDNCNITGSKAWGSQNLFKTSWINFISTNKYFFDGILHLRAELTLNNSQS